MIFLVVTQGILTSDSQNRTIDLGQSTNFTCSTDLPPINWKLDSDDGTEKTLVEGGFLHEEAEVKMGYKLEKELKNNGEKSILIIANASKSHAGTYTCSELVDSNEFASASLCFYGKYILVFLAMLSLDNIYYDTPIKTFNCASLLRLQLTTHLSDVL